MTALNKQAGAGDVSQKTYYIHPAAFGSTKDPGHGHVPVVKADDFENVDDAMPISSALSELSHFINRHSDNPKYLKVWGNGATFDNVILRGAYERASQVCPWQFWNDHDVRTIVTLGRVVGFDPKRDMPFDGVAHNALADARHQAKYVSAIWKKLIPATSSDL